MFSPGLVCGFVTLFVRLFVNSNNSKSYGLILMKFSGYVLLFLYITFGKFSYFIFRSSTGHHC